MLNLGYWMKNPELIAARIRSWTWEKLNPDKPWLCPESIEYCERALSKSMRGLEFGSGRSTPWLAKRLGHLTSIEHSSDWHRKIRGILEREHLDNIDYRLIPLEHPENETEREVYDELPSYVAVLDAFPDENLNFILIDGRHRIACIKHCLGKLKKGGFLILDDAQLWQPLSSLPVPDNWLIVHKASDGLKTTCIWQKT